MRAILVVCQILRRGRDDVGSSFVDGEKSLDNVVPSSLRLRAIYAS